MSAFGNSPLTLGGNALSVPSGSTPVGGPGTSTDNAVVRWDGTGGNLVQNSVLIVGDTGNLLGNGALNAFNVALTVTPFTELEVDSTSTSSPRGIMSAQFNSGTDGARFHMRKARGTRASPTTVVTGDNLGRLVASGYDGSNYLENASIIFGSQGTVAATRVPTNIQFWTGTDAAPTVLTEAGRFTAAQNLLIGGTTDISGSGGLKVFGTTAATSTTTGSLQNAGGFGNAGAGFFGDNVSSAKSAAAGLSSFSARNTSSSGWTVFRASNDTSANPADSFDHGVGGTATGDNLQNYGYLYSGSGLTGIRLLTNGGTLAVTINNSQQVSVAATTEATTAGAGSLTTAGGIYAAKAVVVGGNLVTASSTRSGPGAVPVTQALCKVTTTGTGDALTLADGVDGQRITIVHDVDGGSFVLTPATKTGFSTFTSTAVGETISLVFVTTRGWMVTGSYLGTIAP